MALRNQTLLASAIRDGWRLDALRLSESEAENMTGGERAHLREVRLALEALADRAAAH